MYSFFFMNENIHATKLNDCFNSVPKHGKELCTMMIMSFVRLYTGWPISNATEVKKIEYLNYGSSKRADFFVDDRGMSKLYIHKDTPRQTLC